MISSDQISEVVGSSAYDSDGAKVGTVGQIYLDDKSGEPSWATVNTGLLGSSESFVPVEDAALTDRGFVLGYSKDKVKGAPRVAGDGHLTPEDEAQLYEYYGLAYVAAAPPATGHTGENPGTEPTGGMPRSDDGAMTRSEERLHVAGTQRRVAGRVRLRKYVVTEEVTVTVPVRKEKVVLETVESVGEHASDAGEPVTDAEAAAFAERADRGAPELVLHEEVPVVTTEVRAVERVRLAKETVTEQQQVSEEVRKERIIAEGDGVDGRDTSAPAR